MVKSRPLRQSQHQPRQIFVANHYLELKLTQQQRLAAHRRARAAQVEATQEAAAGLNGPPADYDLRARAIPASAAIVADRYPELVDLVNSGSLLVYVRPLDYQERRTDGYREPEEIFILGTSHLSEKSSCDAKRVIRTVKPEIVVVELCKSRSSALFEKPDDSKRPFAGPDANLLLSAQRALSLGSPMLLVTFGLLGRVWESAAEYVGVTPGGEFKAAAELQLCGLLRHRNYLPCGRTPDQRQKQSLQASQCTVFMSILSVHASYGAVTLSMLLQASEEVGAEIVLGDRPVEITAQRCWDAVPWRRRLELMGTLVSEAVRASRLPRAKLEPDALADLKRTVLAGVPQAAEDSSELGGGAAVQWLQNELPEILVPLVHERDLYLSWSMKRSKAANGRKRVVAVVGHGHLRGIMFALETDAGGQLRFKDLVGGRNTREFKEEQRRAAIVDFVRDTLIFGALAWAWSVWGP